MDRQTILVADGDHHKYTLGHMCARGFANLGHEVRYIDTNTRSLPVIGTKVGVGRMRGRFIDAVDRTDPDVVFVIKGDDLPRSTIEEAKRTVDATFCNWNPDNPYMTRSMERTLDMYLDAIPAYDLIFIWSTELFSDLREYGAKQVEHLPFGFDPTVHYPAPVTADYEADVAFVGHPSPKRKRLMKALTDLDVDLAIYGDYWERWSMARRLRQHARDGTIYGEKYCSAFCSADIVVNVVSDHNLDAYNMRSFEIPATGSFMLTSDTDGQRSIFTEGTEAAYYEDEEELKQSVRYFIAHSDERDSIASAGITSVSNHSYADRMSTVLETVDAL